MSEHPTGMFRKLCQNRIFLGSQVYVLTCSSNPPSEQVDFEPIYLNGWLAVAAHMLTQGTAQTGKDLVGVEGLRHVIVGTKVESSDLFLRCLTG